MSKYSGVAFDTFLVDGYSLAASLSESVSMGKEPLTQQTNPFGMATESHTPVGIVKGMLTVAGGFFDAAADALHVGAGGGVSTTSTVRVVCAAIEGNTIGKHFMGFEGAYSQKYEVLDAKDGLTKANVVYLISGAVDDGTIIQNHATFTADWDTKTGGAGVTDAPVDYTVDTRQRVIPITSNSAANPSVVTCPVAHGLTTGDKVLISGVVGSSADINGERAVTVTSSVAFSVAVNATGSGGTGGSFVKVDSNAGGVGYIQCTAFSGLTNLIDKIMHSPDDSTYATLITFATLTAIGKERKTVSGTIDRYLSNNGDVTGSGSVTVFVGFCRN
jgi:hypothetical protein